jgi:hypothetical protein
MNAATMPAVAEAPTAVPSRYNVPFARRNAAGSKFSCSRGLTASSTSGSASGAKVLDTIAQTESRVRGSAERIASSAADQAGAACGD